MRKKAALVLGFLALDAAVAPVAAHAAQLDEPPSRAARSEDPPPPRFPAPRSPAPYPAPDNVSPESGLAVLQFMVGTAGALGGAMLLRQPGAIGLLGLVGTPLVVGGLVGLMGNGSKRVHGSYGWAVGGAALGVLATVPLVVAMGAATATNTDEELPGLGGALLGAAIGWMVLQPLGATIAWQLSSSPRESLALLPDLRRERPIQAVAATRRPPAAPRLTVPLLAGRF
jgi:hypothetical protein